LVGKEPGKQKRRDPADTGPGLPGNPFSRGDRDGGKKKKVAPPRANSN